MVVGGCVSTQLDKEREVKSYKEYLYQDYSMSELDFIPSSQYDFWLTTKKNKMWGGYFQTTDELLQVAKEICETENRGTIVSLGSGNRTINSIEDFAFKCLTEEEHKTKQKKNLADAKVIRELKAQQRANAKAKKERLEKQRAKKEQERLAKKIADAKDKCRSYGFKDETDGMGMCLIELDKLAELEKQTKSIEANSAAQAEAIAKQEADEKNRREAQALINLGNILSGKGPSCSFKCSGGQVVQGSCKQVSVKVGNQNCWK